VVVEDGVRSKLSREKVVILHYDLSIGDLLKSKRKFIEIVTI